MISKGSASDNTSKINARSKTDYQEDVERRGRDLEKIKEENRGTSSTTRSHVSLKSPTAITHSTRRPRPPLAPAHHPFHVGSSFLAAEQFHKVAAPDNYIGSSTPIRGSHTFPGPSEYVNLSSLNCAPPLNAKDKEKLSRLLSDVYSLKPNNGLNSALANHLNCIAEETTSLAGHEPERSAFQPRGNSSSPRIRTNASFGEAKEIIIEGTKKVQEKMVNSCLRARRDQLEDCANNAYDFYRDACGITNHRGDDQEFFMYHSSNPQAPESPNRDHSLSQVDSTEDTIRKRSLRYPEAALVQNPDDNNDALNADNNSLGEDAASILDIPPVEDTPIALRDYRLSLLFQDETSDAKVVPLSRLSRALKELDLQDMTVDDLHEELLLSKEVLAKTQDQLKQNDVIAKKQQVAITDLKAKHIAEKQSLHDRLQRESEENSKLQTKLSALQLEVSQLRSSLRSAKSDLTKSSSKWIEESRNEVTSKGSGRSADLSVDDSSLVATLKLEISDLKGQLEAAKSTETRRRDCEHSDVMRLKTHLERAEIELRHLKEADELKPKRADVATEELKFALAHSENELRKAKKKQHLLEEELEDTKAILASLEASSRAHLDSSMVEVRQLKDRIVKLESDAEQAQNRAKEALELSRREADDLNSEVQRLLQALDEQTKRTQLESSERAKERLEFECKLKKSEDRSKSFADKIEKLERCLAKAEKDALKQTIASTGRDFENHSEKSLGATQTMSEMDRLRNDLREKESEEKMLKEMVKELNARVRDAEARASTIQEEAIFATKEVEKKSFYLQRNLDHLHGQLTEATEKASDAQDERYAVEEELKKVRDRESNLVDEMMALKARLHTAETEMNNEKFRAEEERRMAVETDLERLQEINRLKSELEEAKTVNVTHCMTGHTTSRFACVENKLNTIMAEECCSNDSQSSVDNLINREVIASTKTDHDQLSPASWYAGQPPFVPAPESTSGSSADSASTVPASNSSSPLKTACATSAAGTPCTMTSRSSIQKGCETPATSDGIPLLPYAASPRSRSSGGLSPSWRKLSVQRMDAYSTDSGSESSVSPASPLPLSRNGFAPSTASEPTPFEEEDDSSAELLSGIEDIRRIPNRRLDIVQIQRRLIQSTERLTAAKSKLKVLVEACEENREGQNALKSSVDVVADRISEQTKKALAGPSGVHSNSTLMASSALPASPHVRAMRTMRSTDEVLERYRKFKANRLQISPGGSAAIIDTIIDNDDGEI